MPDTPGATSMTEAQRARAQSERSLADLLHSNRRDAFAAEMRRTFREHRP